MENRCNHAFERVGSTAVFEAVTSENEELFHFSCPETRLSRSYIHMGSAATGNSGETDQLLQRVAEAGRPEWGALLDHHRQRLRRMVALRLDRRLQGRVDASDVIQEAFLEASVRWPGRSRHFGPVMPFSGRSALT